MKTEGIEVKTKICIKCKRELPLTKKYFPMDKLCRDGFRNVCKECKGETFNGRERKLWNEYEIKILNKYYKDFGADYIKTNFLQHRSKSQIMDYATKTLKLHTDYDPRTKTQKQFEEEVFNLTNGEYLVVGKYINTRTEVKIKHSKCNHSFDVKPQEFLKKMGTRCPFCRTSLGEERIIKFLDKYNIKYKIEVSFDNCINPKTKRKLLFDVCVLKKDNIFCLIEFQGKQHYESIKYFGGIKKLKSQQYNDTLKRQYCENNNIKLIEIPYWDFDNIETILLNVLGGGFGLCLLKEII